MIIIKLLRKEREKTKQATKVEKSTRQLQNTFVEGQTKSKTGL